jgi:hypothetical protein
MLKDAYQKIFMLASYLTGEAVGRQPRIVCVHEAPNSPEADGAPDGAPGKLKLGFLNCHTHKLKSASAAGERGAKAMGWLAQLGTDGKPVCVTCPLSQVLWAHTSDSR